MLSGPGCAGRSPSSPFLRADLGTGPEGSHLPRGQAWGTWGAGPPGLACTPIPSFTHPPPCLSVAPKADSLSADTCQHLHAGWLVVPTWACFASSLGSEDKGKQVPGEPKGCQGDGGTCARKPPGTQPPTQFCNASVLTCATTRKAAGSEVAGVPRLGAGVPKSRRQSKGQSESQERVCLLHASSCLHFKKS